MQMKKTPVKTLLTIVITMPLVTFRAVSKLLAKFHKFQVPHNQHVIGGSGGGRRRHAPPPPQQDQFLSFSHMFSLKSVHIRGWHPPPNGSAPPPTGNPGSVTDHGPFLAAAKIRQERFTRPVTT